MTFRDWDRRLLWALDSPPNAERLRFLHAWQALEGGSAAFNPFNTTMRMSGSTSYNTAGVQHYGDDLQGIAATILTLRLSYYRPLLAALRKPNLTALQIAEVSSGALDKWGTGGRKVVAMLKQ